MFTHGTPSEKIITSICDFFTVLLTQYNWNKKLKIVYIFITVINDYNSNKAVIFSSFIMLQENEISHLFSVTKGKNPQRMKLVI